MGASTIPPEVCIITEYMPRGSLYQQLHDDSVDLPWNRTKQLALGTAKGMSFLHNRTPPIIHRDLKSHNLLVRAVVFSFPSNSVTASVVRLNLTTPS